MNSKLKVLYTLVPDFVKKFIGNQFVKVSGANGIISVAKAFLIVISNKVVATIIGTSGVAMIGQLQSFTTIVAQISNGGFERGLTKYVAANQDNKKEVREFIGTAFSVSLTLSSVIGFMIIILSKPISQKIFNTPAYLSILILFGFTLFLYNLNNLFLTIVNGFQAYRQYFKINITTTILGFVLTLSLVFLFKEYGALLALVLSQSLVCLIAFVYIKKDYWISALSLRFYNKQKLLLLLQYSAITIFASIAWPIAAIVIRTYVINNISSREAGLWQSVWYINNYITSIATGSFSVYLLPKLASIIDSRSLKKELISIYKILIPVSLLGFIFTYVFRHYVILILYSREFLEADKYLLLQMVGSFFWVCKSPFMNFMYAKGMLKLFFITELIFAVLYCGLTMILIPGLHVQGIQISYAITMFCHFVVSFILIDRFLKNNKLDTPISPDNFTVSLP
jgi:O-antigen/teichoic acid export membrane protein